MLAPTLDHMLIAYHQSHPSGVFSGRSAFGTADTQCSTHQHKHGGGGEKKIDGNKHPCRMPCSVTMKSHAKTDSPKGRQEAEDIIQGFADLYGPSASFEHKGIPRRDNSI